ARGTGVPAAVATGPIAAAPARPRPAAELTAQVETTAALGTRKAPPSEAQPGAPSPLPAVPQADAAKPMPPTGIARSDLTPEIRAANASAAVPVRPAEAKITSTITSTIAPAEDAGPKATTEAPRTTEGAPAATGPIDATAAINAPVASASTAVVPADIS